MPRISSIISNFTAGEWSPQMMGQTDLAMWKNACKTMLNFFPRVTGGAQKRTGTVFVAEVKDSLKPVRLIPFQYSTLQAYVIEAGDSYLRFIKDKAQITVASGPAYTIGSSFRADDVSKIRYVQDKDLMYMFHRNYPTQKIIRYDHNDWEIKNAPIGNGPYMPVKKYAEVGIDLTPGGDFEEDAGCTSIGTPLAQKRTDYRVYAGTYARVVTMDAADEGFKLANFTTVTGKSYVVRFRVFTRAENLKLVVRNGGNTGDSHSLLIEGIPVNQWSECSLIFAETAGGNGAFVSFLSPAGAPDMDDEIVTNGSFENEGDWYPFGNPDTEWNRRAQTVANGFNPHTGAWVWWVHSNGVLLWGVRSSPFITETDKSYKIVVWVRGEVGGSPTVTVQVRRGDNGDTVTLADKVAVTPEVWSAKEYCYTETNGGSSAYILIGTVDGSPLLIDDVSIKEVKTSYWLDNVEVFETETITMTPSAKTGVGITLTASSAFFVAGHIGSFIQLTHGTADPGYARISSITSSTVAIVEGLSDFQDITATANWREGAWSTKNGYPACGAFYEQRLIAASSAEDPDGVWGSKTTEYEDFEPGVLPTSALAYKLQADIIRWLSPLGQLVAGSVNSEFRIGASSDAALTPTNIRMTPQGRKGSADTEPINMGNAILFVQRCGSSGYGKRLRELSYNYEIDSFKGVDLTAFAEHITGTGIVRMAWMASPYPILWAATADGDLIGLTYDREQNVIGWHRHDVGGTVEDLCVIPGDTQDDLYMVVNRTIAGTTKRYIEVMAPFDYGPDLKDAFFVDCGLSYDGAPTTTITGLGHLEGKPVAILADGLVQTAKTVSGGSITLDAEASVVQVGLPYTSELEPMPLQGGAMEGTSEGKKKRIHGVTIYFHQSFGGEIGPDASNLEPLVFSSTSLFTGPKDDFNFPGDWGLEATILIRQSEPLPMTVLALMPRFRTEDR